MPDLTKQPGPFKPVKIVIAIDNNLFLKDPNVSELGRKIVQNSILLIDKLGYEAFTFKKLADEIESTEASVYRYFQNKHKLLLYLMAWYWNWLEYRLTLQTANLSSPVERLKAALQLLTKPIEKDSNFEHVDEQALSRIVIAESSKVYYIKEVDKVNKEGVFMSYKRLCRHAADLVRDVNPDYPFPRTLISTVIESSHSQKFFSEHLPSLTEIKANDKNLATEFLIDMVFKTIKR